MTTPSDVAWQVVVPPVTAHLLRRLHGTVGGLRTLGFLCTLTGGPGQLRLTRGDKVIAMVTDVDSVSKDLVDDGNGIWRPAVVANAAGDRYAFFPYTRRRLLPKIVDNPEPIIEAIRIALG